MRRTVAGVPPESWEGKLIKHVCKVVRGSSPRPAGSPLYFNGDYLPWVTVADITESNSKYLFRTKTKLTHEGARQTRITKSGTLMLTNSGATLGVPKISRIESGANDGIAMFLGLDGVDIEFLYYYLSSKTTYFREVLAPGVGQPNLNTDLIGNVSVPVPPMREQLKIAEILSTWDEAIAATEQLLANSEQQKKALMQQLLTGKKRLPGFEEEWSQIELGQVLDYRQPTPFLVKSTEYSEDNPTPVLTAGKSFILGRTDEDFGIFENGLPVIIFDDFTTSSRFVDFPFKVKSSAMKILSARPGFSTKYVFEAMQMIRYAVGGHQRHWISIYSNLVVPMPSLEEQKAIALVLSAVDSKIESLRGYARRLNEEKKALMQQLLTGKRRVKVDKAERATA